MPYVASGIAHGRLHIIQPINHWAYKSFRSWIIQPEIPAVEALACCCCRHQDCKSEAQKWTAQQEHPELPVQLASNRQWCGCQEVFGSVDRALEASCLARCAHRQCHWWALELFLISIISTSVFNVYFLFLESIASKKRRCSHDTGHCCQQVVCHAWFDTGTVTEHLGRYTLDDVPSSVPQLELGLLHLHPPEEQCNVSNDA